ncbi:Uncharacterised protein [Vibrio cholerae]|nr:Uncharacterised protein [Vibrio cholerae]
MACCHGLDLVTKRKAKPLQRILKRRMNHKAKPMLKRWRFKRKLR